MQHEDCRRYKEVESSLTSICLKCSMVVCARYLRFCLVSLALLQSFQPNFLKCYAWNQMKFDTMNAISIADGYLFSWINERKNSKNYVKKTCLNTCPSRSTAAVPYQFHYFLIGLWFLCPFDRNTSSFICITAYALHTQLVRHRCDAQCKTGTLRYETKQLAIYQSKFTFHLVDGGEEWF